MKKFSLIVFSVLLLSISASAQTAVEKMVERARKLNFERKVAESYAEINRAIALEPSNPDLYLARADFYLLDDNKAELLKDAQKAAALAPTSRKILYFAALFIFRSQQYEEALKISDQLMTLGEVELRAWHLRVRIKTHLEDFFGAFEDAAAGGEFYPEDDYLKQYQANLVRLMGNNDKALEMYNALVAATEKKLSKTTDKNKIADLKRSLSMFLFSRAGVNFTKLFREQALADLVKAVEYTPEPSSYFMRALQYKLQKMYPEAIADFTTGLSLEKDSNRIQFFIARGDVYAITEKYDEAHRDYEEALKLDSGIREVFDARVAWLNKLRAKNPNQPK
jgi:tetratricopeptide (TPR) repeat protein